MSKLHFSILCFAFLLLIVEGSHGSMILDLRTPFVVPAYTPYTEYGDLNIPLVKKMAQKYVADNVTAVLIGSYEGEGPSMDLCTRQELISAWVRAGAYRGLKIMVEVGAMAFTDMLKLVKFCAEIDVTAIFVLPQQYYKAKTVNEFIEDLLVIYKVAPNLPLIYNDDKSNPIVNSIEVFVEASLKVPTFVGIATDYASAVDLRTVVGPLNKVGPMKDKLILVKGNIFEPLALKIGISLSVMPSLFPKLAFKIVEALYEGDCEKAADLQASMSARIRAINKLEGEFVIDTTARSFIESQKFAYKLITGFDLRQRLPLKELSAAEAKKIRSCLASFEVTLG